MMRAIPQPMRMFRGRISFAFEASDKWAPMLCR